MAAIATSGPCVAAAPFENVAMVTAEVLLAELEELWLRLVVATTVEFMLMESLDAVGLGRE